METIGNHTKTVAPILSLIVNLVYPVSGSNYENHINCTNYEGLTLSKIKMICCHLCIDIVNNGCEQMRTVLHISEYTQSKYINAIQYEMNTNMAFKQFVEDIRLRLMMEVIKEEKYFNFIQSKYKNSFKLINNQNR